MFFVYLIVPFIALFVLGTSVDFVKNKRKIRHENGGMATAIISALAIIIVLGIGSANSLIESSTQTQDVYELEKISKFEQTYQARADVLVKKFAGYLMETYPQHERDIFAKLEPGKLDLYMVKYPELQASKTIMALVDQERSLQDAIYDQQLQRATKVKEMRYRAASPWIFHFLMPKGVVIPE